MLEADRKITKIYSKNINQARCLALISRDKETLNSILGLCEGVHELKKGILSSIRARNLYAANILFRSLIEHYTKFLFVTYKYGKDKNNNVGKDNLIFSRALEIKDYGNALSLATKLTGGNVNGVNYSDAINKFSKEAGDKSIKELKRISEQFNYRTIIKFFEENEPDLFKRQVNIFIPLITEYSELSTFVHGGAYANKVGAYYRTKRVKQIVYNTIMLSATLYSLTFISFSKKCRNMRFIANDISKIVNAELEWK